MEPDAQLLGRMDLGADQVTASLWMDVQVVGRSGAAAQGQLGQPHPGRQVSGLLVEQSPARVQDRQPLEQGPVDGRRVRAGEVLIDVMVGVDQPRGDQATVRAEHLGRGGRPVGRRSDGADQAVGHCHPPVGQLTPVVVDRSDQLGPDHQEVGGRRIAARRGSGHREASQRARTA